MVWNCILALEKMPQDKVPGETTPIPEPEEGTHACFSKCGPAMSEENIVPRVLLCVKETEVPNFL